MNYLDLFHGIGGFALGAHWAGMKFDNHFCSDIEPFAVELYKKRFPDSIQLGDITKIDWEKLKEDYPGEWIISGGFPCQDISVAGKGRGLIDENTGEKTRSGLWYDYQKGINILRPRYAIMENVAALITRGLDDVLRSLSEIGYNAEWQSIKASDVGAPHRRDRVWIISYPGHDARSTKQKQQCENSSKEFIDLCSDRMEPRDEVAYSSNSGNEGMHQREKCANNNGKIVPDSESEFSNGRECGEHQEEGKIQRSVGGKNSNVSNSNKERLSPKKEIKELGRERFGFSNNRIGRNEGECSASEWWKFEPSVGRVAHGVSRRVDRLKGIGNAIVPQIAEILFLLIK